jgi:hypothetical protein
VTAAPHGCGHPVDGARAEQQITALQTFVKADLARRDRKVPGTFTIDRRFEGVKNTQADGVLATKGRASL